jgi:hypothetical protein
MARSAAALLADGRAGLDYLAAWRQLDEVPADAAARA